MATLSSCSERESRTGEGDAAASKTAEAEQLYLVRFGNPFTSSDAILDAQVSIERGVQVSIARCMSEKGLNYAVPSDSELRSNMYAGPTGKQGEPGEIGFGISIEANDTSPDVSRPSQGDAYDSALMGAGGCDASARAQESVVEESLAPFDELFGDYIGRYLANPAVVNADKEWSECMAGAGYEAATSADLVAVLANEWAQTTDELKPKFRQREIAAALASAACSVKPDQIRQEVMSKLMAEFDEKNRAAALEAVRTVLS